MMKNKLIMGIVIVMGIAGSIPGLGQTTCLDVGAKNSGTVEIIRSNEKTPAVFSVLTARPGDLLYLRGKVCSPDGKKLNGLEIQAWRFTQPEVRGISTEDLQSQAPDINFEGLPWSVELEDSGNFYIAGVPATGHKNQPTYLAFVASWESFRGRYPYIIFNIESVRVGSAVASLSRPGSPEQQAQLIRP